MVQVYRVGFIDRPHQRECADIYQECGNGTELGLKCLQCQFSPAARAVDTSFLKNRGKNLIVIPLASLANLNVSSESRNGQAADPIITSLTTMTYGTESGDRKNARKSVDRKGVYQETSLLEALGSTLPFTSFEWLRLVRVSVG